MDVKQHHWCLYEVSGLAAIDWSVWLWQNSFFIGLLIRRKSKIFWETFHFLYWWFSNFNLCIKFECTIIEHGRPIKDFLGKSFFLATTIGWELNEPQTQVLLFLVTVETGCLENDSSIFHSDMLEFRNQEWRISLLMKLLFMTHGLKLATLPQTLSMDRIKGVFLARSWRVPR